MLVSESQAVIISNIIDAMLSFVFYRILNVIAVQA